MTHSASQAVLPRTCGVAFKEWSGVCAALAEGRLSLILRKGGIAESPGAGGFRPEYPAFWLFPTRLHEHQQGLRIEPPEPPAAPGLAIDTLATVDRSFWVEDPERLSAIEAWHVWTAETVRQRFHYRRPGLWVLGVRVFRRGEPWRIEHDPGFDGCRSWVPLGRDLSTEGLKSVIDEDEHTRRMAALGEVLGESVGRVSGGGGVSHG